MNKPTNRETVDLFRRQCVDSAIEYLRDHDLGGLAAAVKVTADRLESAMPIRVMGVGDYDAKSFKSARFTGPLVILSVSEDVARRFAGRLYEDASVIIVGSEVGT